jgi:putative NADPH-quinone reductase
MPKRIAIIQGHPDASSRHYGHTLADTYAKSAAACGHEIKRIEVAAMDFPVLRSKPDYDAGQPPESIRAAQEAIAWCEHMVIIFPLWQGCMPALLKAFFEQTLRPGFAYNLAGNSPHKLLRGKTARIVITMGMPAFFYRFYFRAHGLKNLKRNILAFCGIGPISTSLIGLIEALDNKARSKWLDKMRAFGVKAR